MHNVPLYVGKGICPFADLGRRVNDPKHSEKELHCSTLKYKPFAGYEAPDPKLIFEYLPHGATINFIGDSITRQAFKDFVCQLFAISSACKEAEENPSGYSREITFTSPNEKKSSL